MNIPTRPRKLTMARTASWSDALDLRRKLLVAGLSLALVCVTILGALRVLQSFSGNTISAWRLVLLGRVDGIREAYREGIPESAFQ